MRVNRSAKIKGSLALDCMMVRLDGCVIDENPQEMILTVPHCPAREAGIQHEFVTGDRKAPRSDQLR
jgi:hypothetical protein